MDLSQVAFAVLDVETTGFAPASHRVLEIAVVLWDPGAAPCVGLDTVVRASGAHHTARIHQIPEAVVARAPAFAEVVPTLLRCLAGRVVVGHNLGFDLRHLRAELERVGVELPEHAAIDTMALDQRLMGEGRRTLDAACAAHHVRRRQSHAASADAIDTCRLLQQLLAIARQRGCATLEGLLALAHGSPVARSPTPPVLPPEVAGLAGSGGFEPVSRYLEHAAKRIALQEYAQLLAMALADTSLTHEEAQALVAYRTTRHLGAGEVRALHAQAFAAAILMFCQDARIDEGEVSYLRRLREALSEAGWAPGDTDSPGLAALSP